MKTAQMPCLLLYRLERCHTTWCAEFTFDICLTPQRMTAMGRFQPVVAGRNRPILLKKSAMVSTAEKYAHEIEIFTLNRGFRAQISRSCAQKRHFQQSVRGPSGRTDFFNTIGP